MTIIPKSWLDIARKYRESLPEVRQQMLSRMNSGQVEYLNYILSKNPDLTGSVLPNSNVKVKLSDLKNNFRTEPKSFGVSVVDTLTVVKPRISQVLSDTIPKQGVRNLNLSVIMPSKKQPKLATINSANLNHDEYLAKKKVENLKNVAQQATLIAAALFLPFGSVTYALANPTIFNKTVAKASNNTSQNSTQNNSKLDLNNLESKYDAWISGFSELDEQSKLKTADFDRDGLTNFEEMVLETNPKGNSCGGERSDGLNILASINPATCKSMNYSDPKISSFFDQVVTRQVINERLSVIALRDAIALESKKPIITEANLNQDKPNQTLTPNADLQINTSLPAKLKILTKGGTELLTTDVNFSSDTNDNDLIQKIQKEVVAYPNSVLPGQKGSVYISGRNIDNSDPLKLGLDSFNKLETAKINDSIQLTVTTVTGQKKLLKYKVKRQNLYTANDIKQFVPMSEAKSELTLATSWPNNTFEQRLVLRASLDSTEDTP